MRSKKAFFFLVTGIILSVLVAGCGKSQATTTVENPSTTQPPDAVQNTPVPTTAPPTVPSDIPIMAEATDLIIPNELNITYHVTAPIKDVVDFYQTALPEAGWDQPTNPDSVVGSMAQMARTKANGDRITFSIQYNPVGEFTVVQIYLTRAATQAPN
ncbi:MAG TPA: hypothetical protein VLD65_02010 [Anaerolineales bacterium]|nr:hypothetical protein [Anaerolineales bacterium]